MAVFKRKSAKDNIETRSPEPGFRSTRLQPSEQVTIIGPKLTVNGRIRAKEEVRVLGKVTGNMNVRGTVVVEPGGIVTANIKADVIVIRGKVQGDIDCHRANIEAGGELLGDVASPRMMLADGAVFKGQIDMAPKDGAADKPDTTTSASGSKSS
ncbi:MAG TPA: polymer-forming cytoskeletal protein [Candidatus Aminicenantes bacterium]|nr:polymer-forming cytoskeletal protein [Candidatus Aminicenantes bacterium]